MPELSMFNVFVDEDELILRYDGGLIITESDIRAVMNAHASDVAILHLLAGQSAWVPRGHYRPSGPGSVRYTRRNGGKMSAIDATIL